MAITKAQYEAQRKRYKDAGMWNDSLKKKLQSKVEKPKTVTKPKTNSGSGITPAQLEAQRQRYKDAGMLTPELDEKVNEIIAKVSKPKTKTKNVPTEEWAGDPVGKEYPTTYITSDGVEHEGVIIDGKTYDMNGNRIPGGSTANTAGGKFTMPEVDQEFDAYMDEILNKPDSGSNYEAKSTYDAPNRMDPSKPQLRGGNDLANEFGITNDRDEIEQILLDAADKKFQFQESQYAVTEDKFYDNLGNMQNTVMDTLGKNKLNAIQTGASKGMQSANELAAVLGISEQGSIGANQLIADRKILADEGGMDRSNAISGALDRSNTVGSQLANTSANMLNADMVGYGSELNYDSAIENILGNLDAQRMSSESQIESSKISNPTDPLNAMFGGLDGWEQKLAFYKSIGMSDEEALALLGRQSAGGGAGNAGDTGGAGDPKPKPKGDDENDGLLDKILGGGEKLLDGVLNGGKKGLESVKDSPFGKALAEIAQDTRIRGKFSQEQIDKMNSGEYEVNVTEDGIFFVDTETGDKEFVDFKYKEVVDEVIRSKPTTYWGVSDANTKGDASMITDAVGKALKPFDIVNAVFDLFN